MLVKTCKNALRKAIGSQLLTPFELYTVFLEVANLVNQRLIGRVPNDPDDGGYISPNHMLLGRASPEVVQGPFKESRNPCHRVESVHKIVDSFWKCWSREVFPSLVHRKQWQVEGRNLQVNDVVLVADSITVRGKWSIGRITEVFPGRDGRIRNLKVKTSAGEYSRPMTKVAVIHPREGENWKDNVKDKDYALIVASHAGIFRGARFSSLPTRRDEMKMNEKRAPLKTLAWEATLIGAEDVSSKNRNDCVTTSMI